MNSTHHYFLTAAIAFVLTVSSTSAQPPVIAPQGTVVYHNGQAMILTPAQGTPAPDSDRPSGAFPQSAGQDAGGANGEPRRVSMPAGFPISVRLTSSLSSNRLAPDAPFQASLDAPLEVNGIVIAEPGARVDGRITESDETRTAATKAAGHSLLAFQLTRIVTADGQILDIQTNTLAKTSGTSSRGKDALNTATAVGLGMAFGGFAGGAPVGLIWRGRGKTAVASGTRLEFHLLAPVTFTTR